MAEAAGQRRDVTLEYQALATMLEYPDAPYIARQELSQVWDAVWSCPETAMVGRAVGALLDAGRTPTWFGVEEWLQRDADGDPQVLQEFRRHVENPEFLSDRCTGLMDALKLRRLQMIKNFIATQAEVMPVEDLIQRVHDDISFAATAGMRIKTGKDAADDNWRTFEFRQDHKHGLVGIPTGFPRIDEATLGFQEGKIYVLGARPMHGKTTVACRVADVAGSALYPVIIFAHEMDASDYTLRMVCARSQVELKQVRKGNLHIDTQARFMQALEEVSRLPLIICDETRTRPAQCQALCHSVRAKRGKGLVIVDHLQLERIPGCRTTRAEELGLISQSWLHTLKQTRHTGLILSQLNRDSARSSRAPGLPDLRDSGAIEQDAHGVIMLWRPGVEDEKKPINKGVLMLAKNRDGQMTVQNIHFEGRYTKVRPWVHDDKEEFSGDLPDA